MRDLSRVPAAPKGVVDGTPEGVPRYESLVVQARLGMTELLER